MSNSQRSVRRLNLYALASLGYAVVMIDTMGSCNRGVKFEAAIQSNMVGLFHESATVDITIPS